MQLTTDDPKPEVKQTKKSIPKSPPKKPLSITLMDIFLSTKAIISYKIIVGIGMLYFMWYGASTLWFTDVYYYGWNMLGFAVIAAIINGAGFLFLSDGDDESSGAVGGITFVGIIVIFTLTAGIKDMSHDKQYKIIKDRNVTEIKWYDKDEIAMDVVNEKKLSLSNYYKAKVKFNERGFCRITTYEGSTWTDGTTSYTDYCHED